VIWEKQAAQILGRFFAVLDTKAAKDRGFLQSLHRSLGVKETYFHDWRRRFKNGKRTGFDLGVLLRSLEIIGVDPDFVVTEPYARSLRLPELDEIPPEEAHVVVDMIDTLEEEEANLEG
jgi:hypothetical protein